MKRLNLWIDGRRYVVEECEGTAEIRAADKPRACGDRSCLATVGGDFGKASMTITIKVEIAE